jgi:hypothetical protein
MSQKDNPFLDQLANFVVVYKVLQLVDRFSVFILQETPKVIINFLNHYLLQWAMIGNIEAILNFIRYLPLMDFMVSLCSILIYIGANS